MIPIPLPRVNKHRQDIRKSPVKPFDEAIVMWLVGRGNSMFGPQFVDKFRGETDKRGHAAERQTCTESP